MRAMHFDSAETYVHIEAGNATVRADHLLNLVIGDPVPALTLSRPAVREAPQWPTVRVREGLPENPQMCHLRDQDCTCEFHCPYELRLSRGEHSRGVIHRVGKQRLGNDHTDTSLATSA